MRCRTKTNNNNNDEINAMPNAIHSAWNANCETTGPNASIKAVNEMKADRVFVYFYFRFHVDTRYTGIREPGHNMHINEMNSRIRIMIQWIIYMIILSSKGTIGESKKIFYFNSIEIHLNEHNSILLQ